LAHNPELLLMDEPTAELDGRARRRLIEALRGSAVSRLTASHDLGFIEAISTRVVVLGEQGILADGNSRAVLGDRETLTRAHLV
jgi:cobalt/nickel transport system ATP-binding protein